MVSYFYIMLSAEGDVDWPALEIQFKEIPIKPSDQMIAGGPLVGSSAIAGAMNRLTARLTGRHSSHNKSRATRDIQSEVQKMVFAVSWLQLLGWSTSVLKLFYLF